MRKVLTNQAGFTMLEVLAGMIILSLGLLMLLPMMVISMRGNDLAMDLTEVAALIKDKFEDLKNSSILTSGSDTTGTMIRTWTVTTVTTNLLRLQVTVNWTDREGHSRSQSAVTYMALD